MQVGQRLGRVLLGRRHELRLMVQRALTQGEPDRDEVLLVALEAQVPTCDAVRSVTSWRSAATNGPPAHSAPPRRRCATAAAISVFRGQIDDGHGTGRSVRSAALDEATRGQLVVQLEQGTCGGAPGVAAGPRARRRWKDVPRPAARRRRVARQRRSAPVWGPRPGSRWPVVDQRGQSADRRGDDRGPAGGRLQGDQSERLGAAGHDADVGGPVVRRQQLVRLGIDEVHTVGHAPGIGQVDAGPGATSPRGARSDRPRRPGGKARRPLAAAQPGSRRRSRHT